MNTIPGSRSKTESDHRPWLDVAGLVFIALILRLNYLLLASSQIGFQKFAAFAPDSQFYGYLADYFLSDHLRGPSVMLMVGPGYGLLLAGMQLVFGTHPIYAILLNVCLGTLAPVLVYGLALRLTVNRIVSIAAGLIAALSLTSICMSTHILTDQPLFTIYAAALYCFVVGYQEKSRGWFLAAGGLAAIAAFVRGSGQLAVPIFALLCFVLPVRPVYASRRQLLAWAGLAPLVALVAIGAWSLRNHVKEDQFVFSTIGMLTMRHCLVAQVLAEDDEVLIQKYRAEWGTEDGESDLTRYKGAYSRARARVSEAWSERPGRMLHYYLFNVDTNLRAPIDYVGVQVPALDPIMRRLNKFMWDYGRWLVVLSLGGVILLAIGGRSPAAWILGTHYFAWTLFCGSSFWQGSRLHYTAELAWAILVPYFLWALFDWVRQRFVRQVAA